MQWVIAAGVWIAIGSFFWWARGAGLSIANNAIVVLFTGGMGAVLVLSGESGLVLVGLGGIAYAAYGIYKTYGMVQGVREDRYPKRASNRSPSPAASSPAPRGAEETNQAGPSSSSRSDSRPVPPPSSRRKAPRSQPKEPTGVVGNIPTDLPEDAFDCVQCGTAVPQGADACPSCEWSWQ